jgi:hypothetical protein
MTPEPSTTREASEAIGKLCVGGDRACENGDFGGLCDVMRQLTDYVPEPLHCELEALVAACGTDRQRVSALWDALKDRVYREVRT